MSIKLYSLASGRNEAQLFVEPSRSPKPLETLRRQISLYHPVINCSRWYHLEHSVKKGSCGPPWGPVDKNLPCKARDTADPAPGRMPHATEQPSPCATTTELAPRAHELQLLEPTRCDYWSLLCSTTREATAVRNLHTASRESPHAANEDPPPPKKKINKKRKASESIPRTESCGLQLHQGV